MPELLAGTEAGVPRCVDVWIRALTSRDGTAPPEQIHERVRHKLSSPSLRFALAGAQERPTAFALTTRLSESTITGPDRTRPGASFTGYLELIAVDPAVTEKGLGRALLADAMKAAKTAECTTMMLHVRIDNSRAIRLYEWFGFDTVGEPRPHEISGALMVEMSASLDR